MKPTKAKRWGLIAIVATLTPALTIRAGEIGHFNGGVLNIRDYVVPDPGFYGAIYNYYYTTGQFNNSNGDAYVAFQWTFGPAE
jgi:hypothetical protein